MRTSAIDVGHHTALGVVAGIDRMPASRRRVDAAPSAAIATRGDAAVVEPSDTPSSPCSSDSTRAGQRTSTAACGNAAHSRSASRPCSTIQPSSLRPSASASNTSALPPAASHTRMRRYGCTRDAHRLPGAQSVQQGGVVGSEGIDAQVGAFRRPRRRRRGLGQHHVQVESRQRQRARGADHATAHDRHVMPSASAHARLLHSSGTSPR